MSRPLFNEARPGEYAFTYDWPGDEYGWVTDTAMFDEIDEPVTTVRKEWQLVCVDKVTFHPVNELCPECSGDPDQFGGCGTCDGSGLHPAAGTKEVRG